MGGDGADRAGMSEVSRALVHLADAFRFAQDGLCLVHRLNERATLPAKADDRFKEDVSRAWDRLTTAADNLRDVAVALGFRIDT